MGIGLVERTRCVGRTIARNTRRSKKGIDGTSEGIDRVLDAELLDVRGKLRPASKAMFPGDDELRCGEGDGRLGVLGMMALQTGQRFGQAAAAIARSVDPSAKSEPPT